MRTTDATTPNFDRESDRPEPRTMRAVADKARQTVDRLAERAASAEVTAREAASVTGEKLVEQKEQAQAKVDDTLGELNDFVRKNPLASTGIAFAAGALLTTLVRRTS